MNNASLDNFRMLAGISNFDRWTIENDAVVLKNKNQLSGSCLSGNNNLACIIDRITDQMKRHLPNPNPVRNEYDEKAIQEQDVKAENDPLAIFNELKRKITVKVEKYNQSHCWLYKVIMFLLGRDVNQAYKAFNIAFKLLNKKIPVDKTADLDSLKSHHQFKQLNDYEKFKTFSIYIHLLPLARHLNVSLVELSEVIMDSKVDRKDLALVAAALIQYKTKLDPQKNLEQHLKILDDAGMSSFWYHGTNLNALETIEQHGLGSDKRDYDIELLKRLKVVYEKASGLNNQVFWVAGQPDYSYGYANRSPEWFHFAKNNKLPENTSEVDRAAYEQLVKKYKTATEIALIQIQMAHTPNPTRAKEIIAFYAKHQFSSVHFPIARLAANEDINYAMGIREFNPMHVVVYRLPKSTVSA